ncbi:transmembrane protein 39A isoform X1 [Syngnathoides biaculeatus]|uniref:transmembrane protein 39A isoform X1 n=1 Tax=Syngnathoides biaculeatus TaxID=300417 RepID=UPI002ADDFB76|nr:transmembrane protein 39A isoform X1 [Syngnathoides biaculeatus]XP_061669857.1 transmembrane protein 39A isoform X1 [Syngnathoides biaculeatus]
MPGGRRGPSRQQLSRSALPSLQTLVGGNLGNGTGLRNRERLLFGDIWRKCGAGSRQAGNWIQSKSSRDEQEAGMMQPVHRARNSGSLGLSAPPISAVIRPEPVRHSKIPVLPLDSSLLFEFLLFVYLLVALFVQYVNIYRTVWWYPYSQPPTSTSLSFHLMDYHLAIFITVMLARRLVWTIVSELSHSRRESLVCYLVLLAARLCLLTMCCWVLCWTLVNLCKNHSVLNLLFLGYPFGVYVPLCCFHQEGPKSQTSPADYDYSAEHQQTDLADAPFFRPRDFLLLLRENVREQFSAPQHMPTHTCPPQTHTHTPELIRSEVEELKSDFNRRIKEVLFNSLFSAYYVAFLPLCFVRSTQYYDMRWSCEHLIMVWINAFVMLMSQLLPPNYCDLLHRSASHLGRWQKLEHGSYSNTPQHVWSEHTVWPQGVLVRHSRCLYKAVGPYNVAMPSDVSHARFYFLFHKPLRILNLLIWIETSVVLYQLYSLFLSERWNHTLSLGLILLCNYYVLFKLLRDRIVLGKAYSYPLSSSLSLKSQ